MKTYAPIVILLIVLLIGCGQREKSESSQTAVVVQSAAMKPLSPDSTWRIAFTSTRSGNYDVYIMNQDGSDQVNLTGNEAADWVYYADERLVFASNRLGDYREGEYDLYIVHPDSGEARRLTQFPVYDSHLSSSPDGNRFAVCSDKAGNLEIYVIDTLGNELARLTKNHFDDSDPDWSPDGSQMLLRSNRKGAWSIWKMNSDGSNPVQLTKHSGDDTYQAQLGEGPPKWSPDGSKILFFSYREGNWDLYTMNPDGSDLQNLTNSQFNETWPSWSPDGRRIAYCTDQDGNYEIYIMNADGSNPQRLTHDPGADQGPVWVR